MEAKDLSRFFSYVDKSGCGCWEWKGGRSVRGYGRIKLGGKFFLAHRVSYEIYKGSIPSGMLVCHRCDNPPCVNPDHLYAGTLRQNAADMVERGRHNAMKPGARSGENNPKAKLSWLAAGEIRRLHAEGHAPIKLANRFGASLPAVYNVINNVTWRTP